MSEITAILNFYKRPHVLQEQVNAIKNQTIPPKEIFIWHNHAEGYEIPESVKNDKSLTIIDSSKNFGVWARFSIGLIANTEYVCIFDDDTIPGRKWFENCVNSIKQVNGLLGTIGLTYWSSTNYWNHRRVGWDNHIDHIQQVDFVGHAWFLKREWLPELFKIVPDYNKMFIAGEDMGLSWALQQIGINTYVPPHPNNDREMFGSNQDLAMKYGSEQVAISIYPENIRRFEEMFSFYKHKGFNFLYC